MVKMSCGAGWWGRSRRRRKRFMFLMMSLSIAVPDQKRFPLQIEQDYVNSEANRDALCNKDPRKLKKKNSRWSQFYRKAHNQAIVGWI